MERSAALEIADRASQTESGSLVSENAALHSEPFLLSTEARSPTEDSHSPATSTVQYNVRVLDVTVATLLLLLVLPLMALCAASVLLTSRGPILFRHPRIGRNGGVFECLKFRTMVAGCRVRHRPGPEQIGSQQRSMDCSPQAEV